MAMSKIHEHYRQLHDQCESDNERLFIGELYQQVRSRNHYDYFMSIKAQQSTFVNRDYRIDFTAEWDGKRYAMEVEGGVFSRGIASVGYRSIMGYIRHADKYNALSANGWYVFRFQLHKPQLRDLWGVLGIL